MKNALLITLLLASAGMRSLTAQEYSSIPTFFPPIDPTPPTGITISIAKPIIPIGLQDSSKRPISFQEIPQNQFSYFKNIPQQQDAYFQNKSHFEEDFIRFLKQRHMTEEELLGRVPLVLKKNESLTLPINLILSPGQSLITSSVEDSKIVTQIPGNTYLGSSFQALKAGKSTITVFGKDIRTVPVTVVDTRE